MEPIPVVSAPGAVSEKAPRIHQLKRVKYVAPVYPAEAVKARIQGVVVLECVVGADGRVTKAEVVRGIPLLNDAAVDAVRQWQYRPPRLGANAVSVVLTVPVVFRLDAEGKPRVEQVG